MPIFQLTERLEFPLPELADKTGMLAIGGDLSPERLVLAYENGIFPWYNDGEPIIWWSPDPRMVIWPSELKISRSMRPVLNQKKFRITIDRDFRRVMELCGETPRPGQDGTWITNAMLEAYQHLHELGYVHSVEVWQKDQIVGGLYGLAIGRMFFGESMFSHAPNASKAGFISLVKKLERENYRLIDCQVPTDHLASLGGVEMSREDYLKILREEMKVSSSPQSWSTWSL